MMRRSVPVAGTGSPSSPAGSEVGGPDDVGGAVDLLVPSPGLLSAGGFTTGGSLAMSSSRSALLLPVAPRPVTITSRSEYCGGPYTWLSSPSTFSSSSVSSASGRWSVLSAASAVGKLFLRLQDALEPIHLHRKVVIDLVQA
uniref:Uncharacterized protein n=1 Tax=Anopheles melas TaxID=34690 RepID=A0A182UH33_9DIPT